MSLPHGRGLGPDQLVGGGVHDDLKRTVTAEADIRPRAEDDLEVPSREPDLEAAHPEQSLTRG